MNIYYIKYEKFLYFFIFIINHTYVLSRNKKTNYDLLLEWGKNSVYVTDKIAMNYTDENNNNYYVKQEIKKGEVIISVPTAILFNIESALKLSGRKIKKQFEEYKKQNFDTKTDNSYKELMSIPCRSIIYSLFNDYCK